MTIKMKSEYYIINNLLDENLQSFLRPLDLTHVLFFQAKYEIRYNFIVTNKFYYNFISCFGSLVFVMLMFILDSYYDSGEFDADEIFPTLNYFTCFMFNLSLYIANVLHSKNNVIFIVNIQSARRSVRYCSRKNSLTYLIFFNWFVIGMICFLVLIYFAIVFIFHYDNPATYLSVVNFWVLLFYDFVLFYASRMVKLLAIL